MHSRRQAGIVGISHAQIMMSERVIPFDAVEPAHSGTSDGRSQKKSRPTLHENHASVSNNDPGIGVRNTPTLETESSSRDVIRECSD
jgi:hypothetical protein